MSIFIESKNFNPYYNIALEKHLFDTHNGEPLLYLWQNEKTVVVGKCQNAYEECNLAEMDKYGVHLARRITGGGAVYHHTGNLNFTFIMSPKDYDVKKQLSVILDALLILGIKASFSGRNDLVFEDRKFSGNAFLNTKKACLHHGTILINEDKDIIEKVLNVNKNKIESKGVKSVKSRIINLTEINPNLTANMVKEKVKEVFENLYGTANILNISQSSFNDLIKEFSANEWLYGQNPTYNYKFSGRTLYGQIDIYLNLKDNVISKIKVYSDSLDENIDRNIENSLIGANFSFSSISNCLSRTPYEAKEILSILGILN